MVHWIGVDPDWTVNDLTTIWSDTFETVYRFQPLGPGGFVSYTVGQDHVVRGSRLLADQTPQGFMLRHDRPVHAVTTIPYLAAFLRSEEGDAHRIPIIHRGTMLQSGDQVMWLVLRNRGAEQYNDVAGTAHDALRFDLETGRDLWTYYVQKTPPYFLGLISRFGDAEYHVQFTGRHGAPEPIADPRLPELIPADN